MPTQQNVPMFAPDGTIRMIPTGDVARARAAGGIPALKMFDPTGKQRWVPETDRARALAAGGRLVPDGVEQGQQAPPSRPAGAAPVPPPGILQRIYGKHPVTDSLANAATHAGNFVSGLYHAVADPADENDPVEKKLPRALLPAYRMADKPTIQGIHEAEDQFKKGNYFSKNDYDAQGNYHPSVVDGVEDAIPVLGPFMRGFENDEHTKGLFPAIAGALTDVAVPELVSGIPRVPPMLRRAVAERIAPAKVLDTPVAGDTMTPRERFIAARKRGVRPDLAQATNAVMPAMAKKLTERSILGGPKYEANNAANIDALHAHAGKMLDDIAPAMSREEFGNRAQDLLKRHQQLLQDQAGNDQYAQSMLDGLSETPMNREEFGNMAKDTLLQHQQTLNRHAADLFDKLDTRIGKKGVKADGVRDAAQKILDDNQDYYAQHPTLMRGGVKQAWDLMHDLAGSDEMKPGNTPSQASASAAPVHSFSDLQRLRSDLMQMYQSPDIVGSRSEGWLKQLTGAIDDSMTKAGNGLKPGDKAQFRQANDTWSRMKGTYDNPQNPLFSVVRSPDGLTAANTLDNAKPATARLVQQAADETNTPDLMDQYRRQKVARLLDPAGNGSFDLDGFADRYGKTQKDQLGGILLPEHLEALQDLSDRTSASGPYDHASSKLSKVLRSEDGMNAADVLSKPTPETARQIQKAANDLGDTEVVPQMQRQTLSQLLNPANNEMFDLKNLPSRFTRMDKDRLGGVLTPEQLDNMEDLSQATRQVNFDSNPAGTAKTLQPAAEAAGLADALGSIGKGVVGAAATGAGTGALTHEWGAPAGAIVAGGAKLAGTAASGIAAKVLTSPKIVDAVMAPRPPIPPAKLSPVAVGLQAGAIQANGATAPPPQLKTGDIPPPMPPGSVSTGTSVGNQDMPSDAPHSGRPISALTVPDGATHEVLHPETGDVIGHVVNDAYVPLIPDSAGATA